MRFYLRNKMTGEIRDVEADSAEFRDLVKEVTPGGLSKWEQTSFPHASEVKERAKFGELGEEDLGTEDQDELRPAAVALALEGVAPERNPHLALTPGEIEMGLTPSAKLKDLEEMYDQQRLGMHRKVFSDAADRIADEREERGGSGEDGELSARAGGSDERYGDRSGDSGPSEKGKSSKSKQPAGKPAGASSSPPAASDAEGGS